MLLKIFKFCKSFLRLIYAIIVTFPRDITGIFYLITIESKLRKWERKGETAFKIFRELVKKYPNKPCLVSDSLTLTFKEVFIIINDYLLLKYSIYSLICVYIRYYSG